MASAQVPPGAQIPAAIPPVPATTNRAATTLPPAAAAATTATPITIVLPPIIPPIPQTPATPATTAATGTTAAPGTTSTAAPVQPQTTTPVPNPQYVPITPQTTGGNPSNTLPAPSTTLVPQAPQGYHFGHYEQLCPEPTNDAVCGKVASLTYGGDVVDQVAGFTKCERIGDCCSCRSVSCGFGVSGTPCTEMSAGNYGLYGVQDIQINGRSEQAGGAELKCIGIEGCANTQITALNIKTIEANQFGSLRGAQISVTSPTADFSLSCNGEESCMNAKIHIVIPGPPPGFMCNPAYPTSSKEYSSVSCNHENACKGMELTIDNQGCGPIELQQLECYRANSCDGASFDFRGVTVASCNIEGNVHASSGLATACPGYQSNVVGPPQYAPQQPAWLPVV
jgi:hypothetical protein